MILERYNQNNVLISKVAGVGLVALTALGLTSCSEGPLKYSGEVFQKTYTAPYDSSSLNLMTEMIETTHYPENYAVDIKSCKQDSNTDCPVNEENVDKKLYDKLYVGEEVNVVLGSDGTVNITSR